jgi:hypothetical protein
MNSKIVLRYFGTHSDEMHNETKYLSFKGFTYKRIYNFQCCGSGSARIRIICPDPELHPEFWMPDPDLAHPDPDLAHPDPDPRQQNWHLGNLFSEEKYCE